MWSKFVAIIATSALTGLYRQPAMVQGLWPEAGCLWCGRSCMGCLVGTSEQSTGVVLWCSLCSVCADDFFSVWAMIGLPRSEVVNKVVPRMKVLLTMREADYESELVEKYTICECCFKSALHARKLWSGSRRSMIVCCSCEEDVRRKYDGFVGAQKDHGVVWWCVLARSGLNRDIVRYIAHIGWSIAMDESNLSVLLVK